MHDHVYITYILFILFFYKHFRISAVRPIISAMDGRPQVLSVSFRGGFVLEGTFNAIICALHSRIIDAVEASFEEDAAAAAVGSGIAQSNAIAAAAWAWVHDYVSWILRLRSEIPMKQTSKKTPLTARSQSLDPDQFWTSANTRTGLGQIFSLACILNSLNCDDSSITITSIYFSYESTILISSILMNMNATFTIYIF